LVIATVSLADHVACVLRHQGGAQDPVGALPEVHSEEPLLLAFQYRPVHVVQRHGDRLHLVPSLDRLTLTQADVRDLG
jgi:hypothetical protein